MKHTCESKITTKKGDERVCGRYLGSTKGMTIELMCNRCKAVTVIRFSEHLQAHELIDLLKQSIKGK